MLKIAKPAVPLCTEEAYAQAHLFRKSIDLEELYHLVKMLPAPRNRLHTPEAMERAEQMLMERFQWEGWITQRHPFHLTDVQSFLDYGTFSTTTYPHLHGVNIVALKPGQRNKEALVVIGHYDTVRDSPGADDNTASVAALLTLAHLLSSFECQQTIILVATDMEELGALGGQCIAEELAQEYTLVGVINFETMSYTVSEPGSQQIPPGMGLLYRDQVRRIRQGNCRGDFTMIIYNQRIVQLATMFATLLQHLNASQQSLLFRNPTDLPVCGGLLKYLFPPVRHFARGDHAPFWERAIPALQITDTANFRNPHYHQASDTAETIDYHCVANIISATAATLVCWGQRAKHEDEQAENMR